MICLRSERAQCYYEGLTIGEATMRLSAVHLPVSPATQQHRTRYFTAPTLDTLSSLFN